VRWGPDRKLWGEGRVRRYQVRFGMSSIRTVTVLVKVESCGMLCGYGCEYDFQQRATSNLAISVSVPPNKESKITTAAPVNTKNV
jgi:hypothetical protein